MIVMGVGNYAELAILKEVMKEFPFSVLALALSW
jgi:hypothetical protein